MKNKMIHFVCRGDENKIIKITKQRKRAEDMMTELGICVHAYNPTFYPEVVKLKVGDSLNTFFIEMNKVC